MILKLLVGYLIVILLIIYYNTILNSIHVYYTYDNSI